MAQQERNKAAVLRCHLLDLPR